MYDSSWRWALQPITLGKYQLLKRIAAGGMAEIFVARVSGIPGFEKIVVVKRILPQLATNQEFISMFLDEARIAATLHHPNIVQMYDIGAVDGNYFISMEYLHGEDVRTLMKTLRQKTEPLPVEHALSIAIGLSSGLHYAHEKVGFDGKPLGIVHRDVTPQNVFITYDGVVKIVDFGIAKATNRFSETRYGSLKGKIPYMSPEQCKSEALDRRSDVFAIGIMLYELTTGYRLYKGKSEFDILKRIVEGDIAQPSSLRPSYPKGLETIVMKALAKNRAERYQNAQELQIDLEGFAREHRLNLSSVGLSAFMQKVFGNKVEAWREAQAAGELAAHVAERHVDPKEAEGAEELSSDELTEEPAEPEQVDAQGEDDDDEISVDEIRPERTPSGNGELVPAEGPRRRSGLWLALLALLAVGGGAGAYYLRAPHAKGRVAAAPGADAIAKPTPEPEIAAPAKPVEVPGPAEKVVLVPDAGATAAPAPPPPSPPVATAEAGGIKITTRPPGAVVSVDGKEWKERTPAVIEGLAPGEHQLKVELPGHATRRAKVVVAAAETTAVTYELKAAALTDREVKPPVTPAGDPGELRIASNPSCEVMIDGKSRGSTPVAGLKLPPGNHTVQLVNSRFGIDRTFTVEVRSGEVTKKKYDFPVDPK